MSRHDVCPFCWSDLRGDPIPEASLAKGYYGEWEGGPRFFSRLIGIEYPTRYDGISAWMCPDCDARWDRFTNERLGV